MIRFNNDYNRGALESILDGLTETNAASYAGYGEDQWCGRAEAVIKKLIAREDAMIKFVPGATQANIVAIAAALSPVQSVIAADTGHINCHEAASIESTGHKILGLPNTDGKLTSRQIAACAAEYYEGGAPEYLTEPKLVYISFPTEQGTLYSKGELRAISEVCKKYGMYLFVDGARMGYGLGAEDNDLEGLCGAYGRVLYRRDKVRRTFRRGPHHHGAPPPIPLQGVHEAARRGVGKGLADGAAICTHAGERRVF